ncbi:MAG: hypothetical protein SGJ27_19445 [Candidatus Melainabacteria bacterium]|nr:hypothetical protein [Candidatus Melainabacteria bacterium]
MANIDKTKNESTVGTESGDILEHVASESRPVKVKFVYKFVNFSLAAYALSWFFEGWREINKDLTAGNAAILVAGTLATLFFLAVHFYWIYFEEKSKGTLRKRVELFEKIHLATQSKRQAKVVVTDKGEN